jgi:ATP-dependent Lon protease
VVVTDDALRDLIRYYTREAGVRRWSARWPPGPQGVKDHPLEEGQEGQRSPQTSTSSPACGSTATARPTSEDQVGVVTGLAWTEVGGELLTIEAS